MTAQEIEQVADLMVSTMKAALAPVLDRLVVIEQRPIVTPKDGRDGVDGKEGTPGKDADMGALLLMVKAAAAEAVASLPVPMNGKDGIDGEKGEPGKDADSSMILELTAQIETLRSEQLSTKAFETRPDQVRDLVYAEVQTAVAAIPPAKDGEKGEPGQSVDLDVVEAFVEAHVTKAIAAVPPPKDGTSITVEDVGPLIASEVQKALAAIPDTVDADDVQTLDALFRKELGLIAPRVPRVQKRIVRDAAGKIERVIDEPLN